MKKELLGEALGTALLVFIGCGSVALAVLFGTFTSLWQVALVWGVGVSLAIFTSRSWCPAHLNPAVSLAMVLTKSLSLKKLPFYVFAQLLGAMVGSLVLYLVLFTAFADFETANEITRGSNASIVTAQCFGEFFPNPGYSDTIKINWWQAILAEALGTFLLVAGIFSIVHFEKKIGNAVPCLIGLTVTLIICFIAPYTQAGLNPARDFGPRLVAYFLGWGSTAFPTPFHGFFSVYVVGPCVGAAIATQIKKFIIKG